MATLTQQPVSAFKADAKVFTAAGLYGNIRKGAIDDDAKRRAAFETSYETNLKWWSENQAAYIRPENDPLPEGFPEQDTSSSDWDGKVLINEPSKWLYRFTAEDLAAIEAAYKAYSERNLSFGQISRETFPIPSDSTLYRALKEAHDEIVSGLGFRVLRGLPVEQWTREKQIAIFAGVSAYIGGRRIKQQATQNIVHLRDITNLAADKRPAITVKGQTSANQVFHNDGTVGVIGLITLGVAEEGGLSQLSSVARTYNELASTRRDILREFAKADWKTKTFPDGTPLFFTADGKTVSSSYSRRPYFGFYEAEADVPPLPVEKHLALDAVHYTAEKFSLDLDLQRGDLEYFNNLTVYHARTGSSDSAGNQRHLIRIHLDLPEHRIPPHIRKDFDRINGGEATEWPLEAWD